MICSVCCSHTFTERAHIKGKANFKDSENDVIFNILPICSRCHHYFDKCKAITLHPVWKCWIFADVKYYKSSTGKGEKYSNPFYEFTHSYPPLPHKGRVDRIGVDKVKEKNSEFTVKDGLSSEVFFNRLEDELRYKNKWDEEEKRPVIQRLNQYLKMIQIDS